MKDRRKRGVQPPKPDSPPTGPTPEPPMPGQRGSARQQKAFDRAMDLLFEAMKQLDGDLASEIATFLLEVRYDAD